MNVRAVQIPTLHSGAPARVDRLARLVLLLWVVGLTACASRPGQVSSGARAFQFPADAFAYANELVWEYSFDDATGKRTTRRREPAPDYTHHCFVVARSARQFFQFAHFDASLPAVDDAEYRRLIRQVVSRDPSAGGGAAAVRIPGYANLQAFSEAKGPLLQSECGGAWQSYLQRGHWRMVFPFSRAHQSTTADGLLAALKQKRPPVVHVVRFPQLSINHAVLIFDAVESADQISFSVYDPNSPTRPTTLTFDRASRTFTFPRNPYFIGGRVDVYEIYRRWDY